METKLYEVTLIDGNGGFLKTYNTSIIPMKDDLIGISESLFVKVVSRILPANENSKILVNVIT